MIYKVSIADLKILRVGGKLEYRNMAAKNLTVRKGLCINYGNCSKANIKEIIEVNIGDDFVCPECSTEDHKVDLIDIPNGITLLDRIKKMKLHIILPILVLIGVGVVLVIPPTLPPPEVFITPVTATILIGETEKLTAITKPEDSFKGVKWTWTSSNESVATVSNNGVVTGKAEGSATITAAYKKNKGTAQISVIDKPEVDSITLSPTSLTLNLTTNKEATLTATVKPDDASPNVEWKSDKTSIATVSSTGLVTAVAEGTANIMVTVVGGKTAVCKVTVQGNDLPCGKYIGGLRNGLPNGLGTFTYNRRVLIDDHKMVYAEQGDYITGTFRQGKIVSVQLHDSGGNLKQTVIPQQPASICR